MTIGSRYKGAGPGGAYVVSLSRIAAKNSKRVYAKLRLEIAMMVSSN